MKAHRKPGGSAPDGHSGRSAVRPPGFSLPRIVFVLRSFGLGGAERQAVLLANAFLQCGKYRVGMISFEGGERVPSLLEKGIRFQTIPPGAGSPAGRILRLSSLLFRLRKPQPDLLLPFTDFPNKLIGALWPLSGAAACVWNQRDEGREITRRPLEKRALRLCSLFVANSPEGIEFLEGRMGVPREKTRLIPNIVVAPTVKDDRQRWREKLDIAPETPVLTMLASLSSFKDHETLLEAWKLFQADRAGVRLLLAGRSLDRAKVVREKAAALDGVGILGEVSDTGGLLAASDLLIHSSWREGIPNAVLEAMAMGLPVIATDIPGIRLALGDASPWLVPVRDPAALASAMTQAVSDQSMRREAGEENRERAAKLFSPESITPRWERLIEDLLRGPSPAPAGTPRRTSGR